jgi:predicted nucleic-acid-binding protein
VKKYVIDANALISFVTDRNHVQQEKIAPLFESAARLKVEIICHQHVLTEFIYVMDKVYHVPKLEIAKMLADLTKMPGIRVIHEINLDRLLACWPESISDYGDAVIASVGMTQKNSMIVTFDQKFTNCLKLLGINFFNLS